MRIAWSLKQITLAALGCFLIGLTGLWVMFQQGVLDEEPVPVNMEKSWVGSNVESVRINVNTENTSFVRSTDGYLNIRLTGEVNQADLPYVSIQAENGDGREVAAKIRTSKENQVGIDVSRLFYYFRHGFHNDVKVVIELPEKPYKLLNAETDTGDLTMSSVVANNLILRSDTGDITLEGFTGKKLTASSDTGTIRLRHVDSEVELQSDTGDLQLEMDALSDKVNLESDTGDIQVTMNQAFPMQVDFASDTGKTDVTPGSARFEFELKEKHRLLGKLGSGGPLVMVRTDTGDIQMNVK